MQDILEVSDAVVPQLMWSCSGHHYSLPADDVVEVVAAPKLTQLPQRFAGIAGVFPWQHSVIPMLRLNGANGSNSAHAPHYAVVARAEFRGESTVIAIPADDLPAASTSTGGCEKLDLGALVEQCAASKSGS